MATAKIIIDRRPRKNNLHPVIIRIDHKEQWRPIRTGANIPLDQWDEVNLKVKKSKENPNYARQNSTISGALSDSVKFIADNVNRLNSLSCEQLRDEIEVLIKGQSNKPTNQTVSVFIDEIVRDLNKAGRVKSANIFNVAKKSLDKFCPKVSFQKITPSFLSNYQNWMLSTGMGYGGISVYMRSIRTAFNMAIKAKLISREAYPFIDFKIKKVKTAKRAIKKDQIDKIRKLNLLVNSPIWHHWNYFRFYFNAMGMNFIDVAFLKVVSISDGRLNYIRSKSKRPYSMAITKEMKEVLSHYTKGKKKTDLVFPIMQDVIDSKDKKFIRETYENRMSDHVKYLNQMAKLCGIETRITTYTIRHSYASGMRDAGIGVHLIKQAMGHDNAGTTEIYLSEIGNDAMDEANGFFMNS